MSLIHEGKKFLAYVPYYTHSVTPGGRQCEDCHANEAVRLIEDGKKVPVMDFQNGNVVNWKGVIPLIPEQLDFVYLDKTEKGWVPMSEEEPPVVQFAAYGEPLDESQLENLAQEQNEYEQKESGRSSLTLKLATP
jgi:hypothetical protein